MDEHRGISLPDGGPPVRPERALAAIKLLGSMRPEQVRMALMEQFDISRSTATRIISAANIMLSEQLQAQLPSMAAGLVERLWNLVDKAERENRINAAIKGIAAIAKLTGVAQPSRVTVTIQEQVKLPELSTEELEVLAKCDLGSNATH